MNSVKDRLKHFIKSKGLSIRQFEKSIGVTNGYVNSITKGVGSDKLKGIVEIYPTLNIEWLLTGRGPMKKEEGRGLESPERIERLLTHLGVKPTELADVAGIKTVQNLYDIQKGKIKSISFALADKICTAYPGISLNWLLTGEGEMLNSFTNAAQLLSTDTVGNKKLIPFFDDVVSVGGNKELVADVSTGNAPVSEWIDAGDWFRDATAAIRHYGDSMVEYPSGCILAIKRVNDLRLLLNGRNYVIETTEYRIVKQVQAREEDDFITGYSSNKETYPDGRQIHSPIKIFKETIRSIDMVLGCVLKEYSSGALLIRRDKQF